jgi:hypothetical protein
MFEIAYRIAAIVLCVACSNAVWYGYVERKISMCDADVLSMLRPRPIYHRDTAPIRYWFVVCMHAGSAVMCFIAAIIGWQPGV